MFCPEKTKQTNENANMRESCIISWQNKSGNIVPEVKNSTHTRASTQKSGLGEPTSNQPFPVRWIAQTGFVECYFYSGPSLTRSSVVRPLRVIVRRRRRRVFITPVPQNNRQEAMSFGERTSAACLSLNGSNWAADCFDAKQW